MRTRLRTCAAAVAILAIAVFSFGPAVASAQAKGKQTLRILATEDQSDFLDLGSTGPSLGDQLVFSETLSQRGEDVGTGGVVCTIVAAQPPYATLTFHCVATLSLERGQITLQGLVEFQGEDDPGPWTVAITGGTGRYRGASGQAVVRDVSDTITVYRLRLDAGRKKR